MNLPKLSLSWAQNELTKALTEWGRQIEAADKQTRKTNTDVELAGNQRLILTGDDGLKYQLTIVGGVPTATAI